MKSLADLQKRKEMLQKDISGIEDLLRFKNPKESFSALTHGFTDQFVSDQFNLRGEHKVGLKFDKILSYLTGGISENFIKSKINEYGERKIGVNTKNVVGSIVKNALKIGLASLVAAFVKKQLYHKKWKKKVLGLAMVYLTPFALDFIKDKLEQFQNKNSEE